jgi:hypothetical protein
MTLRNMKHFDKKFYMTDIFVGGVRVWHNYWWGVSWGWQVVTRGREGLKITKKRDIIIEWPQCQTQWLKWQIATELNLALTVLRKWTWRYTNYECYLRRSFSGNFLNTNWLHIRSREGRAAVIALMHWQFLWNSAGCAEVVVREHNRIAFVASSSSSTSDRSE